MKKLTSQIPWSNQWKIRNKLYDNSARKKSKKAKKKKLSKINWVTLSS